MQYVDYGDWSNGDSIHNDDWNDVQVDDDGDDDDDDGDDEIIIVMIISAEAQMHSSQLCWSTFFLVFPSTHLQMLMTVEM